MAESLVAIYGRAVPGTLQIQSGRTEVRNETRTFADQSSFLK